MMPLVGRVVETSLNVEPLECEVEFYDRVFGFRRLVSDDRFCAFSVSDQQVLLLFRKHGTTKPMTIPDGIIPPHDGDGQFHLAFTSAARDEHNWMAHLEAHGVEIESASHGREGDSAYTSAIRTGICWN